jgi:hypothetical protein
MRVIAHDPFRDTTVADNFRRCGYENQCCPALTLPSARPDDADGRARFLPVNTARSGAVGDRQPVSGIPVAQ